MAEKKQENLTIGIPWRVYNASKRAELIINILYNYILYDIMMEHGN